MTKNRKGPGTRFDDYAILPENFNHSKTIKANIYFLLKKYSILLDPEFVPFFLFGYFVD